LIDLPFARRVLIDAYADHLLAEAASFVAVRCIHALTEELSLSSAFVKYLIPVRTDRMLATLARFLGARSFLTDVFADGMFQKVHRDNRIVALFDGNSVVNLHAIINQLSSLARGARAGVVNEVVVDTVCDLSSVPTAFDRSRLSLIARNGSSLISSIPAFITRLEDIVRQRPALEPSLLLARRLGERCASLLEQAAAHRPSRLHAAPESFLLAEQCALCYAAAAAMGLWLNSHANMLESETWAIWRDGHWLNAVLARSLTGLGEPMSSAAASDAALLEMLLQQAHNNSLFSLLPCALAESLEATC